MLPHLVQGRPGLHQGRRDRVTHQRTEGHLGRRFHVGALSREVIVIVERVVVVVPELFPGRRLLQTQETGFLVREIPTRNALNLIDRMVATKQQGFEFFRP